MENEGLYVLQDEYQIWQQKLINVKKEASEAGREIGEEAGLNCDWHDNFGFDDARRRLELKSTRLRDLSNLVDRFQIVSGDVSKSIVAIGNRVSLIIYDSDGGDKSADYEIGGYETPIKGRVSYLAPIIRGIIGKSVGDIEDIIIAGKQVKVEVTEIR